MNVEAFQQKLLDGEASRPPWPFARPLHERHPVRCVSFHGIRMAGSEISLKFAEIQCGETCRPGDEAGKFC